MKTAKKLQSEFAAVANLPEGQFFKIALKVKQRTVLKVLSENSKNQEYSWKSEKTITQKNIVIKNYIKFMSSVTEHA
jgi:hypothetical protein